MKPIKIQINELHKIKFSKKDVLSSPGHRVNRELRLKGAQIKFKLKKTSANITIDSRNRGPFKLEVKIKAVGKKMITVSDGQKIPIKSIHQIKY